ncbi:MAG: hypothetical protein L6V93_12720 [Clostridiales bacterium]|nr:MAG: hypothetical protein L6V93_12720 [Clostridiales bacterium]
MPIHNGICRKQKFQHPKHNEAYLTPLFPQKSMPKNKGKLHTLARQSSVRPHKKTPERAKTMPKQNAHTVTRNVSTGAKKAVKTKDSLLKGTNKAVKTGNSYVGKSAKKKAVKSAKRAAKTQKEITKSGKTSCQASERGCSEICTSRKGNRKKRLLKSQLKSLKW